MAGIFKTRRHPLTSEELTDANTTFSSSVVGSDANSGMRTNPIAGVYYKNRPYLLAKGIYANGNGNGLSIIGEDFPFFEDFTFYYTGKVYGLNVYRGLIANSFGSVYNCKIDKLEYQPHNWSTIGGYFKNNLVGLYELSFFSYSDRFANNTILNYVNNINNPINAGNYYCNVCCNGVFVLSMELYNSKKMTDLRSIPIFKNCIFLKSLLFKWKDVTIPIAYGAEPANYLNDLLASLTAFANTLQNTTEKAYLQAIIAGTFEQTCQIVDDSTQRIFNRYYNGIPIDFTLKTSNNPALTASSNGSYVGAYKGGVQLPPPEIKDINPATLAETANVPDFVVKKPNGSITAVLGASQKLNAVKFTDVAVPKETMLSGSVSDFKSGLGSSIMTVGIIQPLSINTLPQEGFAVVPKDAPGVVSQTLPKLTMKFNGETELFYKASTGLPLTFNDLAGLGIATDKNLALYGTWGVTTAEYEGYLLAGLNTVVTKKINIKYCDIIIYIYNAAE